MKICQLRMRLPESVRLILALVLLLLSVGVSHSSDTTSMTGEWQSFWRHGQALMILKQNGDEVSGTIEPGRGKIEGRLEGRILKGGWALQGAVGSFLLTLSEDGKTFTGRFDSGEYWNGVRVDEKTTRSARFSAAFSPRETLKTVVSAFNEAVFEGNSAASRFFEPLLIFESAVEGVSNNNQRASFWRLLNMSTFRIYDAPGAPEGNEAAFKIGPSGSNIQYELKFRLGDDDRWKVIVEPQAVLDTVIESMLKDLGHANVEALESARRTSPRETMRAFMEGTRHWNLGGKEKALATLDLSFLPNHLREVEGPILADYLRRIIDRAGFVVWQEIPNDPNRSIPFVHYRHPLGSVVIERIKGNKDEPDRWMFSSETLRSAPVLFNAIQDMPVVKGWDELPALTDFFRTRENIRDIAPVLLHRDLLLENWQWIALILVAVAAIAGAWIMARLVVAIFARFDTEEAAAGLAPPVRVFTVGSVLLLGFGKFGIGQSGLSVLGQGMALITVLGFTMLLYRVVGLVGSLFIRKAELTPGYVDEIVSSLGTGVTKLLVVVFGMIACADVIGLPYEGVITGLGVGGVALAFASRNTVSNMLGGVLLMADRPFKRGDLVETDGQFAWIEDVGLRSTRLKTFDDALLIIPNAQLSDKAILNWGVRKRRKVAFDISLTYDTPREKLDLFVEQLREVFEKQPRSDKSQYYVGLRQFATSSIDIEFWGYFNVYGYEAEVKARHAFIGDIIDMAKAHDVAFAFPTRTVHMMMEGSPRNAIDRESPMPGSPEGGGNKGMQITRE